MRDGDKYAMQRYATEQTQQLNTMVARVRLPMQKQLRKKINCLLILDVRHVNNSRVLILTGRE